MIAEKIQNLPQLAGCIDPRNYYMFKQSKYGERAVTAQLQPFDVTRAARLLVPGVDKAQREQLARLVEQSAAQLEDVLRRIQASSEAEAAGRAEVALPFRIDARVLTIVTR